MSEEQEDPEEIEVVLTLENVHKYAALMKFHIEAELGHLIKDSECFATIRNGQPKIVVNVPGWETP